jgi:predicted ATPase
VITGIRITNFKAFQQQYFPIAPLTLLAGLNGSGKSSLTDGVASKLGIQGEWTAHYLSRQGDKSIVNEVCAHPSARSLQLIHQVEAWMTEVSPGLQVHIERDPELDIIRLSYSFLARSETSRKYRPPNVGFGVSYTLPVICSSACGKSRRFTAARKSRSAPPSKGTGNDGSASESCGQFGSADYRRIS